MEAVTKKSDAMTAEEAPQRPQRPVAAPTADGGFFHIYKKGQGYWTRMGTVAGAALIGLFADNFLWRQLQDVPGSNSGLYHSFSQVGMQAPHLAYLMILVFSGLFALFAFHYMNKETNVDFLIATDSEMKKVNWTTKKELIGSTKIVIGFMFVMAMLLLVYDLFFQTLFFLLGVLKTAPFFFKSH